MDIFNLFSIRFKLLKKEESRKIEFGDIPRTLRKADKYYVSFRILNRYGFYYQGMKCLLFSLETLFKLLYKINKEEYTDRQLKKLGHDLRKAFNKVGLDKNELKVIYSVIKAYDYNRLRYSDEDGINEINGKDKNGNFHLLDKLNKEISFLHGLISTKTRERFENLFNWKLYTYNSFGEEQRKMELIDDALKNGDEVFRFDNC